MTPFVRAQPDYYAALEIDPSADLAGVNAAFRRLAWRYHPDRNPAPGATLQFQDINEAHQVLSDSERRAEYDAQRHQRTRVHRRPERSGMRSRSGRTRSRRRIRAVLMGLFAFMFVGSAWVAIYAAMRTARYSTAENAIEAPSSLPIEATQSCAISMEIFPVSYTDERGRPSTAWRTSIRNCWGGSTMVSSIPNWQPPVAFGTHSSSSYR